MNKPGRKSAAKASMDLSGLWAALRRVPGDAESWQSLTHAYIAHGLPWHASYSARQAIRSDVQCAAQIEAALANLPLTGPWEGGDLMLMQSGPPWAGLHDAMLRLQSVLAQDAGDWLSLLYLTRCHELAANALLANQPPSDQDQSRIAKHRQAVFDVLEKALPIEPIPGETAHWLAVWRLRSGNARGALAALQTALSQSPKRYGSWLLQAQAFLRLGREDLAQPAFLHAAESRNPTFMFLLAETLYQNNYWEQALQVLREIVRLQPQSVQAWLTLGTIESKVWQSTQAHHSLQQALQLDPHNADVLQALDDLHASGVSRPQFERSFAEFEQQGVRSNGTGSARLLMQSLYQDHISAQSVADLHLRVGDALLAEFAQMHPDHQPPRWDHLRNHLSTSNQATGTHTNQRLRIGYISGDLHRQHPVNVFMLPVLLKHDHAAFEIFIYHCGSMYDSYTRQAQDCADKWREVKLLDDNALHDLILADQIDVLVDLAGHTSSQRLGVFAMRSAPVQMTYLGYPHSTGLRCIDWLIADEIVAPLGHESLYAEQLARLPGSVFCWAPVDEYPLQPDSSEPVQGDIIFGSFNNLLKLGDRTIALWTQVLNAIPQSKILIKAPSFQDDAVQQMTRERFAASGADPERLIFKGPSELSLMMQQYHDVHIALDPTPYNGGTTSLQALWMGCPLVTLAGNNFVSRMGASFVQTLGHPEWLAQDDATYVQAAAQLAQLMRNKPWSRHALRAQMIASPLCDITTHTQNIEAAYQQAWVAFLSKIE